MSTPSSQPAVLVLQRRGDCPYQSHWKFFALHLKIYYFNDICRFVTPWLRLTRVCLSLVQSGNMISVSGLSLPSWWVVPCFPCGIGMDVIFFFTKLQQAPFAPLPQLGDVFLLEIRIRGVDIMFSSSVYYVRGLSKVRLMYDIILSHQSVSISCIGSLSAGRNIASYVAFLTCME